MKSKKNDGGASKKPYFCTYVKSDGATGSIGCSGKQALMASNVFEASVMAQEFLKSMLGKYAPDTEVVSITVTAKPIGKRGRKPKTV